MKNDLVFNWTQKKRPEYLTFGAKMKKNSQDPGGLEPASPGQIVDMEGALDHSATRLYFEM